MHAQCDPRRETEDNVLNLRNLLTLASVTILVGVEVLGASLALGWAVSGIFGLSKGLDWAITGLCLAAGAWATWKFFLMARKVEPI